ncbi:prolipoprotein diacylglyceryl transferase [Paenibacillus albicereus]|uniref:Phosphatidylglycerol--prolipoprotein diacylglyceryl transferase n=1 Tax=Paenibacillus albicereus TaxID=2726185 RepID=A0A6H2GSN8_9BACL|nr:prolipoprotein diacylglyceryl transferase [Paenibacillus albicereus]QJC50369.1 prolipoprotein diacylglyceryl transferase [Paenibacillus albicereus]
MTPISLLIDPIAFNLGPITVHWYGIILGLGALAGLLLAIREGKRFGLSSDFFMDILLLGVPSAIIAARAYFVLFKWDYYRENPGEIFAIWNGGIAIYGALIGAVISAMIYCRAKGYSFWRIADICAPSLLIGQIIGRWGNFVNQEAYGGPVTKRFLTGELHLPDWIVNQMYVEKDGLFHHPTFLYESLWNVLGIALIFVLRRRPWVRSGEVFFTYLIWYSIGRFFIEGLRTDSLAFNGPSWLASLMDALWSPMTAVFQAGFLDPNYGDVRSSQLIAVLTVLACVILIAVRRRAGWSSERYSDPILNRKTGLPAGAESDTATAAAAKRKENQDDPQNQNPTV